MSISPFIRHWEAAKFDAEHLAEVNSRNLENRKRRRRRRRDAEEEMWNSSGALLDHPQEEIRMNFTAHDRWVVVVVFLDNSFRNWIGIISICVCCREFKLVLLPNPTSIFAEDVQFESTTGPIDYDVGRIHSGHLEGKFHSILQGRVDVEWNIERQRQVLFSVVPEARIK